MEQDLISCTPNDYEAKLAELQRLRKLKEKRRLDTLARARRNYSSFAEYVLRDESTGGNIFMAPIHQKWIEHIQFAWSRGLHAVILAPYGSGKCQTGHMPIQLADGSIRTHKELENKQFEVLAFNDVTFQFEPAVGRCISNGVKQVRRITTQSGRQLECSLNHPFWTIDGWKECKDLVVDDFVGRVKEYSSLGKTRLKAGEARLLGYFVGDGNTSSTTITNEDDFVLQDIKMCSTELGFNYVFVPKKERASFVRLSNGVRKWLRMHNLFNKHAYTKTVPDSIWTACDRDVADFIGAYFDCDGSVNAKTAEFYSVNKELLQGIQSLLLRLGIQSILKKKKGKYNNKTHWSWRLSISDQENLKLFRKKVSLVSNKLTKLVKLDLEKNSNPNTNLVPKQLKKKLKKSLHWHKQNGLGSIDNNVKYGFSNSLVLQAARNENNDHLIKLLTSPIAWDRIVEIEDIEDEEVFAVEVDNFHTYISNDFIVHNTFHCGVGIPLYLFGHDPSLRMMLISANDKIARDRLGLVRQYIEYSDAYHEVFPNVSADENASWTKSELFLTRPTMAKDPSLCACGVTSSGIGKRSDIIVFDDVNDAKNTIHQPKMRDVIWQNFTGPFISRLEPGGKVLIIACLTGDTKVTTEYGSKEIKDLSVGDKVWSLDQDKKTFVLKPVTAVIPQPPKATVHIKTKLSSLRSTFDHPFLTIKDNEFLWKQAEQLVPGDYLVRGRTMEYPTDEEYSLDFCWLFGFLMGDGWTTEIVRKGKQAGVHSFCTCVAKSIYPELNEKVVRLMENLFLCRMYETKFGYYRTDFAEATRRLQSYGLRGTAHTKRLPEWIWTLSVEQKRSFLKGFLDADGWAVKGEAESYASKLCNKQLLQDLRELAEMCGVRVSNITTIKAFGRPPNSKVGKEFTSYHCYFRFKDTNAYCVDIVESVVPTGIDEFVWDISVKDTENFLANNIVSHNTRWHEQDLIGKLMSDVDMRQKYAFLIQRVTDDFSALECETIVPSAIREGHVKHRTELKELFSLYENNVI